MVRAILDDRKTMTRRVITPQPPEGMTVASCHYVESGWSLSKLLPNGIIGGCKCESLKCPYGKVGDLLRVRETFVIENPAYYGYSYKLPTDRPISYHDPEKTMPLIPHYRATGPEPNIVDCDKYDDDRTRWTSPRFMPKWAARIWLEITGIRVERVQEITEEECYAEGINPMGACHWDGRRLRSSLPNVMQHQFRQLWDSLNAKRGYGWDVNPWVWAISFKRAATH